MGRTALAMLLAVHSSTACQSLSERRQADLLLETLRDYETTVRWGQPEQLQGFGAQAQRSPIHTRMPADLRITRYQVVQGPAMIDRERFVQQVVIEYVLESTQRVKEILDEQIWLYDWESETWSRQNPLPAFR